MILNLSLKKLASKAYCRVSKFLVLVFILSGFLVSAQNNLQIDSLQQVLEQETNDSLRIIRGLKLSREIHRKQHNEEKEFSYAQEAIESALRLNDTLLYARALDNFGLLYRYHQQYEEALELHSKAFELIENKAVKPDYKMRFANNAGVAGRYHQKYAIAISYYMKALKIAERENNLKDIAIASNGIGNALGSLPNRQKEALEYFKRSLKAEKERDNTLGMAMNYLSISGYYIDQEDFKTARQYLNKLLKLNQKREDKFGLAITYEFMGRAYLKEGKNLDKAAAFFTNALNRFKNLTNHHKEASLLHHLGNTYYKKEQFTRAEDYYRQSIGLAKQTRQNQLIKTNSFQLSKLLEKQNNSKRALFYYKQARAYEDSIKLTEQNLKIEALTRKYNIEKKENRIQLLQKDKALQQTVVKNQKQKLERRQTILILLAVGLFLLLIIFLLQYRNYRTKKKITAKIQQEEKEKMQAIYERNLAKAEILVTRLRINPHFLFNSLNAIMYLIQSEQNFEAIKYLKVFSRYTRMVLETSKQHVIPLQEELKLANYYLLLEGNRFEEDFKFIIKDEELSETEEFFIPPLLLQPFLENAIWHGLLTSKSTERVLKIEIQRTKKDVEVIIEDNGVGRNNTKKRKTRKPHKSMGMQIIKERIELYNQSYSSKIDYKIIDKKDENNQPTGTKIVLSITKPETLSK